MICPDPTHQPKHPPTHPPNHTATHGWGSLHRFQIFKQNWNILISSSAIEFLLILGVPPGGCGGGWMWVGDGERVPPTHMHIWHDREFPGIPRMGVAICMKLSCLPCMHVHGCVCMYAHACTTPSPSTHPPTTPTLSTHPPPPRPAGSPNHQNSITLELIEIIRFCLKILYLWTFLN